MKVKYEKGEILQEDCSCDSEFMTAHMNSIGQDIRAAYDWVPQQQPIYLVIDNAGGHGKKECIAAYTQLLKDDYNVIIKHQEPRSPETNLLDLGIWNSMQSYVEKQHRHRRNDNTQALVNTCNKIWTHYDSTTIFEKVYQRWLKVLNIIISDNGDNRLIDAHRKELFQVQYAMQRPLEAIQDQETAPATGTPTPTTAPTTATLASSDVDGDDSDDEDDIPEW